MGTGYSASTGVPSARQEHVGTWRTWRYTLGNYLFVLPFFFFFSVFIFGPILYSLYMSLFRWEVLAPEKPFVGLGNFAELMRDDLWWLTLRNTLYMAFLIAVINTVFALAVAIAVNQPLRGRDFYRVVFYGPVVFSVAAMGVVMAWVMNPQYGVINYMLAWVGLPTVPWLSSSVMVIPSVSLATVWWTFGFPMLIYLAGLQGIPQHLYEAASIDGANAWRRTWHITLPLMRPSIFFVAVTQLISHFKIFGQPYIMTEGGPGRSSYTVIMYLYQTAWRFYRMGYGTAIAVTLAFVILFFTLLQFRFFGRGSTVEY